MNVFHSNFQIRINLGWKLLWKMSLLHVAAELALAQLRFICSLRTMDNTIPYGEDGEFTLRGAHITL